MTDLEEWKAFLAKYQTTVMDFPSKNGGAYLQINGSEGTAIYIEFDKSGKFIELDSGHR